MGHWERVIDLVQTAFRNCILSMECTWETVVVLPKLNGDFRGIGIMDVIWKTF